MFARHCVWLFSRCSHLGSLTNRLGYGFHFTEKLIIHEATICPFFPVSFSFSVFRSQK